MMVENISEYFSVEKASVLPPHGSIHVIGVCGVAMAPLAVMLAKLGYQVSGSDKEFYEPMSSLLNASPVILSQGFSKENISSKVDLVIIGNSIRRDNNEVKEVEQRKLSYTFLPKVIGDIVIGDKHSVVVSGTHGKSTTTALLSKIFLDAALDPSLFVGGISKDFSETLRYGQGTLSVVEGDEYDSAFFAKTPKFHFYKPSSLIITSLEFDHADIYSDIDSIANEFRKLIAAMLPGSLILGCGDYDTVRSLRGSEPRGTHFFTYGFLKHNDIHLHREISSHGQTITPESQGTDYLKGSSFTIPLMGEYNALNSAAAYLIARDRGVSHDSIQKSFSSFQGLKRRQEILFADDSFVLIEDFAHHPTAVAETLKGLQERYPYHTLCALFEPRSNTSRRRVFEQDYINALSHADKVLLSTVTPRPGDEDIETLRTWYMADQLSKQGTPTKECSSSEEFIKTTLSLLKPPMVLVLMSNGSFDGLPQKLKDALSTYR